MSLFQQILLTIGIILAVLIILLVHITNVYQKLQPNYPTTFHKEYPEKRTIAFMGDSLTHARLSADYTKIVGDATNTEIINAGINGQHAYNLLQRVDELTNCNPDYIYILIGTNDAFNSMSKKGKKMAMKTYDLPQEPTFDFFVKSYDALIKKIQTNSKIPITLITLPTIGEDINSKMAKQGNTYSDAIKKLADENDIDFIPLNERMSEALMGKSIRATFIVPDGQKLMIKAIIHNYFGKESWNAIGKRNNFIYHSDLLHLNETGSEFLAKLIIDHQNSIFNGIPIATDSKMPI